jgi:hypothetical protein
MDRNDIYCFMFMMNQFSNNFCYFAKNSINTSTMFKSNKRTVVLIGLFFVVFPVKSQIFRPPDKAEYRKK